MDWHSPSLFAILDSRPGKALLEHSLPADCTPAFSALSSREVHYLITGGAAMNLHGIPRLTDDLDLLVDLREGNLVRFQGAMEDLGYLPRGPEGSSGGVTRILRDSRARGRSTATLSPQGPEGPGPKIDLVVRPPLPFDEVFRRRGKIIFGDLVLPVLSIEDMIAFLRRYGRERDTEDVRILEKVQDMKGV
ncbi:MAG: nucleotidyl transferase AbiEii/AbiGii toxin family protein [bacterium]|nr:MAG: nucleotidyl transferase AbiEii/AbiGii toxin family protein [bacterium]